jgi:hypothetical protein
VAVANTIIKAAAIVRAGYEYQDLVGIEVLIRYFRDPELYDWVKLEAVDSPYGALDDLVAARADGSYEFTQVKFTVDEGANLLDWDWLLKKKPKGTSLLAKWSKALANVRALGKVHSAELRTNRLPSDSFAAAMKGALVDVAKLDAHTRNAVDAECGGAAEAEEFFGTFAFKSGEKDLDSFEHAVKSELVPHHLDPSGWTFFRDQVRRWAMRIGEPFPDGKIKHQHLSQIITQQRSEPIRQDFRVPADYQVPSAGFDGAFRTRIADRRTPLTILWGTPGRGKSTYLSFLTDALSRAGKAVIRHHYFLSAQDTSDRISFFEISNSLVSQLFDRYPEAVVGDGGDYDQLRKNVEAAANYFAERDERFYVVIDGLDHVWRDTRKVDQLNFMFNKLLPLPNNVSLIVGTQRVDPSQLPSKLVSSAKERDWIEIPAMDQVAVHRWVQLQDDAGRVVIAGNPQGPYRQEQLDKTGVAFFDVSQGHPLHLIYAFESLTRSGRPVRPEDVEQVPPCPDGDIRTYYASLWNNLNKNAREILHMLSGSDFYWPSLGIRQCIGSFDDVAFLLEHRNSGMVPFHGSIFAYVRERVDHADAFRALLPRVVRWLQDDAPPFWRWGWLWLFQARLGDFSGLMTGVSRDWAIDSLAEGWPERQAIKILEAAETRSFSEGDLPRTIQLRSIKTRLMNAREFQIQRYADFEEASIASARNMQQLRNLADELPGLSDDEVLMLAKAAPDNLKDEIVAASVREYSRRVNVWIELRHRPENEFVKVTHLLLDAAALCKKPEVKRILRFLNGFKKPQSYVLYFAERLSDTGNVDALLALRSLLKEANWESERARIDDNVLRSCCFIRANPSTRLTAPEALTSPLRGSWLRLHKPEVPLKLRLCAVPENLVRERHEYGLDTGVRDFFHEVFFSALATALAAEGDYQFIYPGLAREGLGWMETAIDTLEGTAREIADGTSKPSFSTPFLGAANLSNIAVGKRATESDATQYRSFAAALRLIALDLHLIGLAPGASPEISKDELEVVRGSTHWNDEACIERALEIQTPILTKDAASAFLQDEVEHLSASITEFNERAGQWVQLARFGLRHKLDGVAALVRRAADCLLAYGWRKDVRIFDVLDAVRDTHDPATTPALEWISTLVPVVDKITEFTDGDETRHARTELIEVVSHIYPDRLPRLFKAHIDRDEWNYADECLKHFVGVADFDSHEAAALISTFLDPRTLDALEAVAKTSSPALSLLKRQLEFLGGKPTDHNHRGSSDNPSTRNKRRKDPTKRGPNHFKKLVGDVKDLSLSHGSIAAYFAAWLKHWKDQGKGKEALDNIRDYFAREERTYPAEEALDQAFEMSLAIEGRDRAYWFIVAAHIHRHGWQSHWNSSEEVMKRLRWASEHYPDRWMDFIRDTSEPESYYKKLGYGFSIGDKYLVRFLLLVDQRDLAAKVVNAFVRTIVEEVHDQPIPETPWFH